MRKREYVIILPFKSEIFGTDLCSMSASTDDAQANLELPEELGKAEAPVVDVRVPSHLVQAVAEVSQSIFVAARHTSASRRC